MPPTHVTHRPQTIKQARKAYRKSGATVRLSESEQAIIERRAVLQERADRIKEREARRKANIKKKEERNQREREARQRMGIGSPVKEGIHVGPSQLSLGKFMVVGQKRKREDECPWDMKAEKENVIDTEPKGCQTSSLPRMPWRNPLKVISPNSTIPKNLPVGASRVEAVRTVDPKNTQKPPPAHPSNSEATPQRPATEHKLPTASIGPETPVTDHGEKPKIHPILMGPPPSRKPVDLQIPPKISQQKPQSTTPQEKPPEIVDDSWDDFFASSTQIARELSPPPLTSKPLAPPPPPSPLPNSETTTLLAHLSTQDLDFSASPTEPSTTDLLAQISTQDLDFTLDSTQAAAPPVESPDFDDDLTEEDLEDAALEFERASTGKLEFSNKSTERSKEEDGRKDQAVDPEKGDIKTSQPPSDSNPPIPSSPPSSDFDFSTNPLDESSIYLDGLAQLPNSPHDSSNEWDDDDPANCDYDEDIRMNPDLYAWQSQDTKLPFEMMQEETFGLSTQDVAEMDDEEYDYGCDCGYD